MENILVCENLANKDTKGAFPLVEVQVFVLLCVCEYHQNVKLLVSQPPDISDYTALLRIVVPTCFMVVTAVHAVPH